MAKDDRRRMSSSATKRESSYPRRVIGIDPDADRHGVAVYDDGRLQELLMASLSEVLSLVESSPCLVSIENVMANQFVYSRNNKGSRANVSKIAMSIGRCQQAQVELCRQLEQREIPMVLHRPQSGNWAKKKELFERLTGWSARSNEDTRAAAFFGWLSLAPKRSRTA